MLMITIGDKLSLIAICFTPHWSARPIETRGISSPQSKTTRVPDNQGHYSATDRHPNYQSLHGARRLLDSLTVVSSMPIGH